MKEIKKVLNQVRVMDSLIKLYLAELSYTRRMEVAVSDQIKEGNWELWKDSGERIDVVKNILDYENKINEAIDTSILLKSNVLSAVEKVTDPIEKQVLFLRYVRCVKTWDTIAEDLGYEVRQVYRIHTKALRTLKGILYCVNGNL